MPNFIISADHLSDLAIEGISDLINIVTRINHKGWVVCY